MPISGPNWTKEIRIKHVEQRLAERKAREAGRITEDLDAAGIPDAKSLEIWLAKERDGQSWQQIAQKYQSALYGKSKSAAISAVRRAYKTVENSPNPRKSFKHAMDQNIRDVFGCSPEEFKRYLDGIRVSKRRT